LPDETSTVGRDVKVPPFKLTVIQYLTAFILLILVTGLWRLQVLSANNWRVLAEQNRIRKVPVLAPRGKIYDRDGRLLVDNYPSVSCYLLREQMRPGDADLPMIATGLHMTVDQIQQILHHYRTAPRYQPIPLKEDITPDEQAFIAAHSNELPELETLNEQRRLYPRNGFAAHLIGYVGEVSEEMLNNPRYAFYQPGDVVGKSGVEQSYDQVLRGVNGSRDIIVNSHGKEVGMLGEEPAVPGKSLRLTIDIDIQRAAEQAMGNRNGAIVALDPRTGEVLAMVSRPTFDPNAFSVSISREEWSKIINDPDHPLMNKAIQAQLAPGSTFKIIMSVAGLQDGVAQNMHVDCQGGGTFYGRFFKCDRRHGMVDIEHAIPWSCDTFYYTLAQKLGIDEIARWAHRLGLGEKTGIDLPNEATGVMPSTQWKMRNFHQAWYPGETISVGIGQGAVAVTPLQIARALGGIASGGVLKRPHVVFPSEVSAGYEDAFPGSGDVTVPIDPANWQLITDAMAETTNPGGTAFASHLQGIDFAGKTGTAQTVSGSVSRLGSNQVDERDNAWFVGMAPRRNPEIVVAVLWQGGGWGAGSAHLAAEVIEAYVNKQRRLAHNLLVEKPAAPPAPAGEMPSTPDTKPAAASKPQDTARLHAPQHSHTEMLAFWSNPARSGSGQSGEGRLHYGLFHLP
jgi:penicillin-binding protein 2